MIDAAAFFLLAALQPDAGPWEALIDDAPDVVARGYDTMRFAHNAQLWRAVMRCDAPRAMTVDTRRTCLVCSIDDVGGYDFGGKTAPRTAVSITAAYARFSRGDDFAWRLVAYEPFGGNHRARNGEIRHRASVNWIRDLALSECDDLNAVVGTEPF